MKRSEMIAQMGVAAKDLGNHFEGLSKSLGELAPILTLDDESTNDGDAAERVKFNPKHPKNRNHHPKRYRG